MLFFLAVIFICSTQIIVKIRKRNGDHDGINERKEGENEASNDYSPSSPSILCPSFGNDESSPIFGFDNDCFDIDNEVLNNY